jgi:hypothetical protein
MSYNPKCPICSLRTVGQFAAPGVAPCIGGRLVLSGCPFDRLAPRGPRPEARGGTMLFWVMLTFSASVLLSVHSPEPTPIVIYNDRSGLVGVGTYPRAGSPEDRLL